jgi:hypothetical protein
VAQIRSSRWWIGLTALLGLVFLASAAALTFVGWPQVGRPAPQVTVTALDPSAEPSGGPITHPAPLTSEALTVSALSSVTEGWVLVEYDSSSGAYSSPLVTITPDPDGPSPSASPQVVPGDGPSGWRIPGPLYLYVVDPSGLLYAAGNLGVESDLRLLAWLPDRQHAVLSESKGDGTVTLHTLDLISGQLSRSFVGPNGKSGGEWVDPEVRMSTDGEGMLIAYGSGKRGIARVSFDGSSVTVLVPPVEMSGFVQSTDGGILVVGEKEVVALKERWTIATYTSPNATSTPNPSSSVGTPSTASPSPAAETDSGPWTRDNHGLPPGESRCFPVSWPPNRQLLNACPHSNGTVPLYTLALMTSTFVDVSKAPAVNGDDFLVFNNDGTRIARGRTVLNLLGDGLWRLVDRVPTPTGVVFAGDFLLAWGDADSPGIAGSGASEIRVRKASDGQLVYTLNAIEGASGFHTVVAAPAGD